MFNYIKAWCGRIKMEHFTVYRWCE